MSTLLSPVNDTTIIIIIGMSFVLLENEHITFLYSMSDIELCVEAMKLRHLEATFPFAFLVEVFFIAIKF